MSSGGEENKMKIEHTFASSQIIAVPRNIIFNQYAKGYRSSSSSAGALGNRIMDPASEMGPSSGGLLPRLPAQGRRDMGALQ